MAWWSVVVVGNVEDGAQDDLRSGLGEFFSDPRFGTGHTSLVIGSGCPVSGLHAGERACEPAAV